jgi:hypothetical protein
MTTQELEFPTAAPLAVALTTEPSEMSPTEYAKLIQQIQTDWTLEECQTELLEAARYNEIDIVRALLHAHPNLHAHPQVDTGITNKNTNKNTALHMAAANGHAPIVSLLLAAGADATVTNVHGNTPLHWAAANARHEVVQLLTALPNTNVLRRNQFGRSALTEGFASDDTAVVACLLEHESASEEKLVQSSSRGIAARNDDDDDAPSVTHTLRLGRQEDAGVFVVKVRELAMASSDSDTILGQDNPADDTTGLGIWAASLVCAQWMYDQCTNGTFKERRVLELGSGCGLPGLTVAAAANAAKVYLTDFNTKTVDNLKYNVKLNDLTTVQVLNMNWQDESTWPAEKMDFIIGSDLIYQESMAILLVQTVKRLLDPAKGKFCYVAPDTGRNGQEEFLTLALQNFHLLSERDAPCEYFANPLLNQDDDECFLHFHELKSDVCYKLYEFEWKKETK